MSVSLQPVTQDTTTDLPFRLLPATADIGPVILSAPHGGTNYPSDLGQTANLSGMQSLEDTGTAQITEAAAQADRPALIATYPRALIDLNRPIDALDPGLWPGAPPPSQPKWQRHIKAGYGLIPRLSADRQKLYSQTPPISTQMRRISEVYTPYHAALRQLISEARLHHQHILLIDIHSMPGTIDASNAGMPDYIFGDLHGVTLPKKLKDSLDIFMGADSFSWRWNHPFAGGHITQHYGTKDNPIFCLQIEVNRQMFTHSDALDKVSTHITALIDKLSYILKAD